MKKTALFALFLSIFSNIFAQSLNLVPSVDYYSKCLTPTFARYTLVEIDAKSLQNLMEKQKTVFPLTVSGPDFEWNLTLSEYDLLKLANSQLSNKSSRPKTFKINNNNQRSKMGCLTIADQFISGFVDHNGIKTYIEPLNRFIPNVPVNKYVLYSPNDVILKNETLCGHDIFKEKFTIQKKDNNTNSLRKDCVIMDLALASDYALVTAKGGPNQTEAHLTSIVNQMQTWFDDEFEVGVELGIAAIFIPATLQDDPFAGLNSIDAFLTTHRTWGNGGGYGGADYAAAYVWTNKITSGAVGLTWLNAICTNDRYVACSDFGTTLYYLGILMAHETGHLLGVQHEPLNGYIMSPGYGCCKGWSDQSKTIINNTLKTATCFGNCSNQNTLSAEFEGDLTEVCPQGLIKFTDMSVGNPVEWNWEFTGGNPSSSKIQNPTVQYDISGTFNVKLTIKDVNGNIITIEKKQYIKVNSLVKASFSLSEIDRDLYLTSLNNSPSAKHEWDFGDGSTSTEANPTHNYIKDGNYNVVYCVEDICNKDCKTVKVSIASPVKSDFLANTKIVCSGEKISFKNLSSENSTQYYWKFVGGNPSSSTSKDPVIKYEKPGVYEVSLTVYNAKYTDVKTVKTYIKVKSPIECPKKKGKTRLEEGNVEEGEIIGRLKDSNIELSITPNPSSGVLNIYSTSDLKNSQIEVYNCYGKQVEYIIQSSDKNSSLIELKDIQTGIHFIRIKGEQLQLTKKVLIQK